MQSSLVSNAIHHFEARLAEVYFFTALLFGALYAFMTPPFFALDEASHSMRGVQIANGTLLARINLAGPGDLLDSGFVSTADYFYSFVNVDVHTPYRYRAVPRIRPEQLNKELGVRWSGKSSFGNFPNTRIYPPTFYFPASLGWLIAEQRGLTIMRSLILARLCNLVFVATAGWAALRFAKDCRLSIAAILLIPTMLALDGSCSQEGLILSLSALGVALLSRPIAEKRLPLFWELGLAGVAMCACGMTRPPYTLLLIALFLPAIEQRRYNWRSLLPPLLVAFFALMADVGWSIAVRPLGVLLGNGANIGAQVAFLRDHPLRGAGYILYGLLRDIPILSSSIASAGSGDVRPPLIVVSLVLLLVAFILLSEPVLLLRRAASRLLVIFLCVVITLSMALVMYITFTAPEAHLIEGLQIRYFFPLLLFAPLFSGLLRPMRLAWRQTFFLALIFLNLWIVFFDPHIFYGYGLLAALRGTQF